jgi:hypothetical protein
MKHLVPLLSTLLILFSILFFFDQRWCRVVLGIEIVASVQYKLRMGVFISSCCNELKISIELVSHKWKSLLTV